MRITITLLAVIFCSFNTSAQEGQLKSYDALCTLFSQNYASLEEKDIDWDNLCETFRKEVTATTTDTEFFHTMTKLLKPLNDAHTTLRAKNIDSSFSASRPSRIRDVLRNFELKERRKLYNQMITNTLDEHGFEPMKELGPNYNDRRLFRFTKNENVGYIQFLRSFSKRYWMNGPFLGSQLNKMFNSLSNLDAMIIDIRFNIGGDDGFSEKVAGRFVEKEVVAYYKQTRKNGEYGSLKTKTIKPRGKKAFLKPVVLLTNDRTVSAADVLALIMLELPNATIIGEPSNGSYSDLASAKLPNGWRITYSHQRYLSADKKNYEGKGTPVDIEVKNTLEDLETGEDSVLQAAFEYLRK